MPELTFDSLKKQVADLAHESRLNAEGIGRSTTRIAEEAQDTTRVAESIAGLRVDPATVGEAKELGKILEGVSDASLKYAATAFDTAKAAQAVNDQNQASHAGINEAVSRSNVSGIRDVNREWLRQE